jgi:hypothetical protein
MKRPVGAACLALLGWIAGALVPLRAAADSAAYLSPRAGATLLLPYFEVTLPKKAGAKPKGLTTVFTVRNTSQAAALVHVTIWSDLGVPVTFFDLYLTGLDMQEIDLSEVIDGRFPVTATAGQDPADTISPKGLLSQDINFATCTGSLPGPEQLPPESVAHMRAALTGKPSPLFGNQCLGHDYGEKKPVARGYVTVDLVNSCSLLFPTDPGYFLNGGVGIAIDFDQLAGEWFLLDRKKKTVYGASLVPLRADAADPLTDGPGDYTFYARLLSVTGADNRQPLPTSWMGRFVNEKKDLLFPGGTSVIAWRDPKVQENPFPCGTTPNPFPLAQEQILAFDEEENVEEPQIPAIPPLPPQIVLPFPLAAQIAPIGGDDFPVSFERGFVRLNLNTTVAGQDAGFTDPAAAQSFVTMVLRGKRGATAVPGTALDSAASADHTILTP